MSGVGAVSSSIFTRPIENPQEPLTIRIAAAVAVAVALFVASYVVGYIANRGMKGLSFNNTYTFFKPSINFKNLIGEDFLKEKINERVKNHFESQRASLPKSRWQRMSALFSQFITPHPKAQASVDFYKEYGGRPLNGMLLYGPPGCGKTHIAECIAGELGLHFIKVTTSTFGSPLVHQAAKNIANLFNQAITQQDVLILIDDADASIGKRDSDQALPHPARGDIISECLKWLPECSKANVFVVMTTNSTKAIDPALKRSGRISLSIEITPPNKEARAELLKYYFTSRCNNERLKIDYTTIAEITNGFTQADLEELSSRCADKGIAQKLAQLNTELVRTMFLAFNKEKILQHLQQQFAFFCEGTESYFSWEPLAEAAKNISWAQVQRTVNEWLEAILSAYKQDGAKISPERIEGLLREKLNLIS